MRKDVNGLDQIRHGLVSVFVPRARLRLAQGVPTVSWRPHPRKQSRLGTRPHGMRESQTRGNEEDGSVVCFVHGKHGSTDHNEEDIDKQGRLDQIRHAVEVDSATRSCCSLGTRSYRTLHHSWTTYWCCNSSGSNVSRPPSDVFARTDMQHPPCARHVSANNPQHGTANWKHSVFAGLDPVSGFAGSRESGTAYSYHTPASGIGRKSCWLPTFSFSTEDTRRVVCHGFPMSLLERLVLYTRH
jgi:hypothetical protein